MKKLCIPLEEVEILSFNQGLFALLARVSLINTWHNFYLKGLVGFAMPTWFWAPLVDNFGTEILHKMCLACVNPFVMVWLIILRDMFILSYYYLMWIDIDFFCAYVVDHLVARLFLAEFYHPNHNKGFSSNVTKWVRWMWHVIIQVLFFCLDLQVRKLS